MDYSAETIFMFCFVMAFLIAVVSTTVTYIFMRKRIKEPENGVFILDKDDKLSESLLAKHFCLMTVTNAISEQCLFQSQNLQLWIEIRRTLKSFDEEIYSMDAIHDRILEKMKFDSVAKKETVKETLDKIKENVYRHLQLSSIRTPPFFYPANYVKWINIALRKIEIK